MMDAVRTRQAEEQRQRMSCPCGGLYARVATLDEGNETGYGELHLLQCVLCKTVKTGDRC